MTAPQSRRRQISVDGRIIRLTPSESRLAELLVLNSGRTVRWPDIIEYVWPDPDRQPLDTKGCLYAFTIRLKTKGVPIFLHLGWGLAIGLKPA